MRITAAFVLAASTFVFSIHGAWGASGDLDPAFGTAGVATATFAGAAASADAVVRQSDGKLVAAGEAMAGGTGPAAIAVARFDATGALDAGFGSGGTVTTDIGAFNDYARQVLVQSDGKIVVVAQTYTAADGSGIDIGLIRYDSTGALDATYGTGGIATISLGSAVSAPYGAAIQGDNKVVVVGGTNLNSTFDEYIARVDTAGALDGTFASGGFLTLDFGGRGDGGRGAVVQPDGSIVVAGTSFNGPLFVDGAVATLTRVDSTGTLDAGFGTGGSVVQSGPNITLFNALVLQGDGKLVTFGASGPSGVTFRLFRYGSTGALEGGFAGGPSPFFMTSISSGALAIGPAGEFSMIGDGYTMQRVKSDGSVDTDFAVSGRVNLGLGARGSGFATLIEPSGDIILAGTVWESFDPNSSRNMALVRVLGSSPACVTDADCGSCERCGGSSFCVAGARTGCTAAAAGKAGLKIKRNPGKSKLTLKWLGSVPSFDPTTSDDVGVCIYHGGDRILKAVAPADGTWTGAAPAFSYLDKTLTPDGVRKMFVTGASIKGGASGPQLDATAQGVPSPAALGPLGPQVLLQLHLGDSSCVEATFDAERRVTGTSFTGKSE